MVEGIFLRVPADVAKKQLEQRTSYSPRQYLSADNAVWSRVNIQILRSLFTSSKIADEYEAQHKKSLKGDEMDYLECSRLKDYIRNLAQAIESFPQDPSRAAPVDIADQLTKLAQLRVAGVLSPEEFDQAKAKLLG